METKKEIRELFVEKKNELNQLRHISFKRELTKDEMNREKEIKQQLLSALWPIATSIVKEKLSKYPVTNQQFHEACCAVSIMFRRELKEYDPSMTSPEVYFTYYFELSVDNYIIKSIRTKSLTEEQVAFIFGKTELANFERIKQERPLTHKEREREDFLKSSLFEKIWRYGKKISRQIMEKYMISCDADKDVMQSIAEIFFKQLPKYDPYMTTPTTYFSRYFKQVIDEYVHRDSQHLSQYDAHNVSKVRAAIHSFEARGVKWDEEMLINHTKLSRKVLRNTLYLAHNSKRADVDDCINLDSGIPTPEDACIQSELSALLNQVLMDELTEKERLIFLTRVNLGGSRELPYDTVANMLNMPVRDVKKTLSSILAKLQCNHTLLHIYNGGKQVRDVKLNMQKRIDHETEQSIVDGFASAQTS